MQLETIQPAPLVLFSLTPNATLPESINVQQYGPYSVVQSPAIASTGQWFSNQYTPKFTYSFVPGQADISIPTNQTVKSQKLVVAATNVSSLVESKSIEDVFAQQGAAAVHYSAACSGTGPGFVVPPDEQTLLQPLQIPMVGIRVTDGCLDGGFVGCAPLLCGDGGFTDNTAITVAVRNYQRRQTLRWSD